MRLDTDRIGGWPGKYKMVGAADPVPDATGWLSVMVLPLMPVMVVAGVVVTPPVATG